MNSSTYISDLKNYLAQEIDYTRQLSVLIKDEKAALVKLDEGLLILNSEKKQELIDSLQEVTTRRMALMRQHGFSPDQQGVTSCIESAEADAELADLFKTLNENAVLCARENRNNGQLINRRSSFLTQNLESILQNTVERTSVYQADGKTDNRRHLQHLYTT
jgi:flagellar biosynthesis/type III secretory pathway chaperone